MLFMSLSSADTADTVWRTLMPEIVVKTSWNPLLFLTGKLRFMLSASSVKTSACLSWAMAVQNRAYLIPKHNPTCHSKCLSVVGVCERACSKTALAPGRDPCCCLCGEGGKEGRSWQHWKENGYSSYFCKLPHPILVMKVLQSLPLWRTLVVHILPLGRHLSHI